MKRWIVIWGDSHTGGASDCVFVDAEDRDAAAQEGIDTLLVEVSYDSVDDLRVVAVVDVAEATLYSVQLTPALAELQCCGGLPGDERFGGHTACCPERPAEFELVRKGAAAEGST